MATLAEDSAAERPAANPRLRGMDPERVLVSTAKRTPVLAAPNKRATETGYLRSGAVVRRAAEPREHEDCPGGYYPIEPEGFVCLDKKASLDPTHVLVNAQRTRADRSRPLPYVYGRARSQSPLYTRVPSLEEQRATEAEPRYRWGQLSDRAWSSFTLTDVPEFLRAEQQSLYPSGRRQSALRVNRGHAAKDSTFAFLELFRSGQRTYGLSTDFALMPLDRLEPVVPSAFEGVQLDAARTLPLVFVRANHAQLYGGTPETGLDHLRAIAYREAFSLSGKRARVAGQMYLETTSGLWLAENARLTRVEPMLRPPGWATPGRPWIDVSILRQTLVAYLGTTPVFATLVSTGADGLEDPETSRATVQGQFLIHTKHVSVTMRSDEEGDSFDLRDVPYVQYFSRGYALHAAYWHDGFGTPRSHGCVNLSPKDARWLFEWTDPHVPAAWHGAMSLRDGTLIHIHP